LGTSKLLKLENLTPMTLTSSSPKGLGSIYLALKVQLDKAFTIQEVSKVILPPLQDLAKGFGCSQMMIYDVLQEILLHGYNYHLNGFEQPILLWQNAHHVRLHVRPHAFEITSLTESG
jgi:hypothetical protein